MKNEYDFSGGERGKFHVPAEGRVTMPYTFSGKLHAIEGEKLQTRSAVDIKNEPMLFNASWQFATETGGPITREVLTKLGGYILDDMNMVATEEYSYPVIDTRVHMLMKGQYPAIPGWHCDNVPRRHVNRPEGGDNPQPILPEASDGQINYTVILAQNNIDLSPTQFVTEDLRVRYDPRYVWGSVNEAVCSMDLRGATWECSNGVFYRFSSRVLHRATPARVRGWRFFFRLSWMQTKPKNEVRRQVQVYADPNVGW